jgi:Zn-dependent peptidase ImmA (M78 family)
VRNRFLDPGTAEEIEKLVDRVHKSLGRTDGAIALAEVRELLSLDLQYYTADDPNLFQEVVHKVRVGAKQLIRRPALLLEAIKKFDLKALILPDRKRILIDSNLPDLKKRWSEAHEAIHSLIPWHKEYLLGDTKETLSPGCHEQLESEANYGAGRLLFPHRAMLDVARSSAPSIAHIKAIADHFGNTITSALWRYVESCSEPCLGVIGAHPHHLADEEPISYFIRSPRFEAEFGDVTEAFVFEMLRSYCSYKRAGPLGFTDLTIDDAHGVPHVFRAETFSNSYQLLTLVTYLRPSPVAVALA